LLLQDYDLHFTEPWFLGKRLSFDIDLFHRQNYYNALHGDYNETFDGGTFSLTKALGNQFLRGTVSLTMENVHLSITPGFQPYTTTNYFGTTGGLDQHFVRKRQLLYLQIWHHVGIRHAQQLPHAQRRAGFVHLGSSGHAARRHGILQIRIAFALVLQGIFHQSYF
jgi:hypothetical protein